MVGLEPYVVVYLILIHVYAKQRLWTKVEKTFMSFTSCHKPKNLVHVYYYDYLGVMWITNGWTQLYIVFFNDFINVHNKEGTLKKALSILHHMKDIDRSLCPNLGTISIGGEEV